MIGAQYIHDHVMHFYHLHALDWVDVVSALSADPRATAELAQSLSSVCTLLARILRRRAEEGEGLRRVGTARHLRQCLLGPSGLQAAARGEPARGGALSRRARLAAGSRAAAHDLRRQESAPALPGGRRAEPDRPRFGLGDERQAPGAGAIDHHAHARVRRPGVRAGHARDRELLQGLGAAGRRARQFPVLRRSARARHGPSGGLSVSARRDPEPRSLAYRAG